MRTPDPSDPSLPSAFDHPAFYVEGEPYHGEAAELDTGLRCSCGREVVAVWDFDESPTGWAHVGVGDENDRTGMLRSVA